MNGIPSEYLFKETTDNPQFFFDILPEDWKEGIVPYWSQYEHSARIFALATTSEAVGGGIIFSTISPDTQSYKEEAQSWFNAGFLYIGFLFISEQYRGKHLGTKWLNEIFAMFPEQKFWLSIEEKSLCNFYQRNGFSMVKPISISDGIEWIMARPDEKRI